MWWGIKFAVDSEEENDVGWHDVGDDMVVFEEDTDERQGILVQIKWVMKCSSSMFMAKLSLQFYDCLIYIVLL